VLSSSAPVKKPSLASLKPDKPKSAAARKKAVQKIADAHVIKKTAQKAASSKIVTKKITNESSGLSIKRVGKTKKVIPPAPEPILVLPTNMSIRAREKALAILEQMTKDFGKSAEQIAYVSGLCFILLGASMSFAFSDALFSNVGNVANTASSTLINTENTTDSISTDAAIIYPDVSLIDPLPKEILTVTKHKLAVVNVKTVYIKTVSLETGRYVQLPIDDLSVELYEFILDPEKLDPGRHEVRAYFEATDGSRHQMNLGNVFKPFPPSTATNSDTDTVTEDSVAGTSGSLDGETNELTDDSVAQVVDNTVSTTTETVNNVVSTTTPSLSGPSITVDAPGGDLVGDVLIKAYVSPVTFKENVRFYVREKYTTNRIFVGTAERYPDFWRFYFNTRNVKNGDYELFTIVTVSGKEYFSKNTERIRIANFVKTVEEPSETESETEDAVSEETVADKVIEPAPVIQQEGRSLPDFTITDVEQENENEELIPVTLEVADVIAPYEETIRALLNRYAIALQSGDALLLEIAKREIEAGKRKIVEEVLADKTVNFLADDVERILEERFTILEKRVATFEELRKTASNNESSIDTDKDGVSDVDEKTLYNTDPTLPDTDNDGVLDGIEIMKGFNPTDPSSEAVIKYEMPQETSGLVENTVLKVETVVPVIKTLDDDAGKQVHAEIKGTALPNSYVTIYVFSTPTIVTARADENGIFSYTFDKELEDGEHEVYVAITDNTGAIMARSNPFTFVKKAEAFTPVDTNAGDVVGSQSINTFSTMNSYNTVVGLGILAFGLILLMLGVSMREKSGAKTKESIIVDTGTHGKQTT
jgi:hypothetical protein